jgi:hypothetical protein
MNNILSVQTTNFSIPTHTSTTLFLSPTFDSPKIGNLFNLSGGKVLTNQDNLFFLVSVNLIWQPDQNGTRIVSLENDEGERFSQSFQPTISLKDSKGLSYYNQNATFTLSQLKSTNWYINIYQNSNNTLKVSVYVNFIGPLLSSNNQQFSFTRSLEFDKCNCENCQCTYNNNCGCIKDSNNNICNDNEVNYC